MAGNNLDILSWHIGFKLSLLEREKTVRPFSADLYAEGPNGVTVVIENQLEKTNHDCRGRSFQDWRVRGSASLHDNIRPKQGDRTDWRAEGGTGD
jgi:hypothetical protein